MQATQATPMPSAAPTYAPLAKPTVGNGEGAVPYNTMQVHQYEPTADSATVDVYTGISDMAMLTKLRERAVYDLNALSYAPIASSGTGVLFPNAVTAKTEQETALRIRPTTFRGPQQLDVGEEDGDIHINRQMHPNATNVSDQTWYKQQSPDGHPFVGYPNPELFYFYTDPILTHNVQNLSHAQLTEALRTEGTFDHNEYISRVGAILKSGSLESTGHLSLDPVVPSDGGGVNGDPRLIERIADEYERDFQKAWRLRVADATNDARFGESAPGAAYIKEQYEEQLAKETQFSKVAKFWGIGSGFAAPERFNVS